MLTAASAVTGLILPTGMALAQAAPAASPPAQAGNAGHYRFRVGDISATVLSDGLIGGPPRVYASDAPEAELQEVLRHAFLPTDRLTLNLNTLLIETNGRRILLEAGAGQTMGPQGGSIFENLAAIGLTPEDIDAGMKLGCNQPIGPLALADMIGLDVCLAVMEVYLKEFGDSKYRPCYLLREMVAAGRLGRKTGQGVYTY